MNINSSISQSFALGCIHLCVCYPPVHHPLIHPSCTHYLPITHPLSTTHLSCLYASIFLLYTHHHSIHHPSIHELAIHPSIIHSPIILPPIIISPCFHYAFTELSIIPALIHYLSIFIHPPSPSFYYFSPLSCIHYQSICSYLHLFMSPSISLPNLSIGSFSHSPIILQSITVKPSFIHLFTHLSLTPPSIHSPSKPITWSSILALSIIYPSTLRLLTCLPSTQDERWCGVDTGGFLQGTLPL